MKYAITGADGYLAQALIPRLKGEIRCLGHSEEKSVKVSKKFPETKWLIGDINDAKLYSIFKDVDVVFHLAAQKHIPVAEQNPILSIDTNILGSANVAKQAVQAGAKEVIGISTDKACKPQTVYGMTKYLMERLFQQYNNLGYDTKFYTVRYGNVANSSGSVFEVWDKLGKEKKDLEITVPEMTRFYWTVDEAVDFIFEALEKKQIGKPLIPTMKAMKMGDVADVFAKHYKVKVKEVGNRGNEKIHEDLDEGITSENAKKFTKKEIEEFLKKLGLLQKTKQ